MVRSHNIMLTLSVVMLVIVIGTIAPTSTVSASTNSISKIQSGLVSSDSLTTGNTAGWTFGGTATLYNYYEDSQGLHLGVQAPSSGRWVNYYAASSGANAHLFHAALTIPYTSVPDGVFNPGLYVEGSNYNGIVGCQAYADNTGYYWTVQSSTDAGSTWTTLYAPPANSLPQTDDCTVMTDGNHYLKVYIGGNVVFSSTTVNLNMPTPLHAFVQVDSSSSSMDHAIYSNYYSTTDENIKITNNPSNAAMVKVIGTAGNVLATAPVSAGTAILNVGMYKFPLSGTIDVYDSNNSIIASSPASIYGGDVYSVSSSSGTLTVPQSPTSLTATAISSSQINLSWTAPSNNGGSAITGYKIERSTDSGATWSTVVANTASVSTTYSDSGLAASTAYTYRVSAINSVGTSMPSNISSATTSSSTTTGSIVLDSVKTTSGTVSSSPYQITLSNVNVGTGTNRLLVVGVEANNQFVTSVTFGGTQLTKAVRSFHNDYTGFWYLTNPSGTGNIVVTMAGATSAVIGAYSFSGVDQTTPIPTNITNYDAAAGSPTISITTQYPNSWVLDLPAIYGGTTLGSPTCTQQWNANIAGAITGASSSSVKTSAGLATCGWTASGSGDMWDDAAIEIKASGTLTVPQSPTSLTATAISSSQINLSWTAPSNNGGSAITGYKIERSTDSGITWSTVVANTASVSTTYSDSGLAASTAYTYRVSAINSVGTGSPSNTASATTQNAPVSVPQSPTNLTASAISSSQINLSWTAPSNNGGSAITGYKIERSTDSGITWSTVVANTASVSTTYSDTGLAPNTAYTYRVSAINSVGTGSPSNTASATTSSSTTTGSIILNSVKTTSGTVSSLPYQITLSNVNVGTGTNRLLVVGVTANNQFVTSVTFGGTQLTKAVRSFHNDYTGFWYLTNPSGTGNIVVTMDGSTSVVVGAYSFSGVDQTTPIPTNITNYDAAASSPTISITTQYPNSWVLDLPAIYGGVTLGSPTCTQQWNINMPSAITGASSSSVKTSAGLATCGWTASGSGDLWDDAAIEIKASGTVITTNPQSLTLIKSGLLLSDSLTNETKTQQQLQTNPGYWRYGGDAQAEKAHYTFWKDTQGLHIGVQAPSNATWAGIYALSRNTQAMLYHSIITTPVQTIPANNVYYNNGIYVQTNGTSNVNYVACSSNVSSFGTVWAVFWATGNPFSATNFTRLWYDPNPNQPLTRDCTIITNGNNYLRVYVDGVKVVDRTDMNLQMPPPFNVFLEPQSSYAGQMLNGTFTDYYTLAGENVTVNNLPQNAARVDITDSSGKILATSQIVNHIARLDVGQYHFPLSGTIKVYDSGNIMIASDSSNIYGGDVYSVNH